MIGIGVSLFKSIFGVTFMTGNITDEDGNNILDESSNPITDDV